MYRIKQIVFTIATILMVQCTNTDTQNKSVKATAPKHYIKIPDKGIETIMESGTQKILEGTEGSIVIAVGEVTRKKASISIRRGDIFW
jgi:hypothetical protein